MTKTCFTVLNNVIDQQGKHTWKQAIPTQSDKRYDLKKTGSCENTEEGADTIWGEVRIVKNFFITAVI